MYVLPYGQMSLWGATVITNLISAIPWIGQDIVESIFKNNTVVINLCLESALVIAFALFILFSGLAVPVPLFKIVKKKLTIASSSSLLRGEEGSLPTIGVIHNNALKKGNKSLRRRSA